MKTTALGVLKLRSSALNKLDSAMKEYSKQTAPGTTSYREQTVADRPSAPAFTPDELAAFAGGMSNAGFG